MVKFNQKKNCLEGKVKSHMSSQTLVINCDWHKDMNEKTLERLQIAVYVMCSGGMLGNFAMRQPADFYIDDRVGRLPYPKRDIYQVVEVIKAICYHLKKDAHNLKEPDFPGCWVF